MAHGARQYDAYDERPHRRALTVAGLGLAAAASVAIVAGLGLWGWRLGVRDPGEIPVVRALDGPMKMRPEDPGGIKLEETDLSVTRMISGDGAAEAIVRAPEPEGPADEDLPVTELSPAVASPPVIAPDEAGRAPDVGGVAESGAAPRRAPDEGAIDRLVAEALDAEGEGPVDPPDSTEQAPRVAPVSRVRPSGPRPVAIVAAAEPDPTARADMDEGDIAIQLGAFNSAEVAEAQWRAHMKRNGALLAPYGYAVTTVESGGRTLYRLRAGPMPDRARAQELCAALRGRGDACIVARVR